MVKENLCTDCLFSTDIDECTDPSRNNCSTNANCTDTIGSYDCTCHVGYSGNGYTCDGKSNWDSLYLGQYAFL